MTRLPPISTRIDKLFPYPPLFRSLAKGHYDYTRLGHLHRLFHDARFVVPIRDPVGHVASLMRQHERFRKVGREHPRARRHMRRAGHFEFGLDLRPINRSEEHTSELQSLMRNSYAVFCLKKKKTSNHT